MTAISKSLRSRIDGMHDNDNVHDHIKAFPLDIYKGSYKLGWLKHKNYVLSTIGKEFIDILNQDFKCKE